MGLIVDIVIIAILALSVIMGYKKRLIKVIFNIFAFLSYTCRHYRYT